MFSARISIKFSGNGQLCLKQSFSDSTESSSSKKESNCLVSLENRSFSSDKNQTIRSNKEIIRKSLRNSLQIPKNNGFRNVKGEKLTASSLRCLESENDSPSSKENIQKENQNRSIASFSSFNLSQKSISEVVNDDYNILKKIGQGAHSTVYKCSSYKDNKLYALKKIKNVSYENWLKMKNLFRMIKCLNHENIVTYNDYYFDQEKRTAYVVMQFCDFNDLRTELSRRAFNGTNFSGKEVLEITKQIADVVMYLHDEGICHRDIKPQNILYCKNTGKIKVIDLDVCGVKNNKSEIFQMWTSTGTLFYRAPQSFQIGYTQKVDIWSIGIVAYEMARGELPFQTEYQKDFLNEVKNTEIDFETLTKCSKLNLVLQKCLQKDPQKRISASDLYNILNQKTKDDESVIQAKKFRQERKRKSYSDSCMGKLCLGNLLKPSYL